MKYRYLTYQEFAVVEDDFSNYLYANGFNKYEWRLLQDQYSEQALDMLGEYSDRIFDRLVKDVRYLEYRSNKHLRAIECHQNYMISIGIQIPDQSLIDLTDIESLNSIDKHKLNAYKCFQEVHSYSTDRDQDIFKMIESGCYVVDDSIFKKLKMIRISGQN